ALHLPAATVEAHAETGERSTQAIPFRPESRRAVLWPCLDLLHRAPVLAVPPPMNVPLGVLRPPALDGKLLYGARDAGREHGVAAGARPVCWRVGTRRPAAVELANHPQQLAQQPAECPPTADRAREDVCGGAVVLVLGKLSQHVVVLLAWNRLTCRCQLRGAGDRRQQMSRADGSEAVRRVGDGPPAAGGRGGAGGGGGGRRGTRAAQT